MAHAIINQKVMLINLSAQSLSHIIQNVQNVLYKIEKIIIAASGMKGLSKDHHWIECIAVNI